MKTDGAGYAAISPLSNNIQALSVYPNPFSEQTVLDLGQAIDEADIFIYSVTGEQVGHVICRSRYTTLSRGDLSHGLYLFKVVRNGSVLGQGKLMVE